MTGDDDALDRERWLDEGGHTAPEALVDRERAATGGRAARRWVADPMSVATAPSWRRRNTRPHVLIVGGGVAGLETLLALRALAETRVKITLLTPEAKFVNRSMAVRQPFAAQRVRGLSLADVAVEFRARLHRGTLDRVDHPHRRVFTRDGDVLSYDVLVLALGARAGHENLGPTTLSYHGNLNGPAYRLLLHQFTAGQIRRLAFVRPPDPTWPLPIYDLALMTAAYDRARYVRSGIELHLVTPEIEPLAVFGATVSSAVRELLDHHGVTLHTDSYSTGARPGHALLSPGGRDLAVDRIVTVPRLVGPRLRGVRSGQNGFIHVDDHGRVFGRGDGRVFAAGDATDFPVKQGGLAAQQADVVAEQIAADVGVDLVPQPFRPTLRGLLLTGADPRYLRADISGRAGDDSTFSEQPLWAPPNRLCGRYLAPYLSHQSGSASDVMPEAESRAPIATYRGHLAEMADLTPQ